MAECTSDNGITLVIHAPTSRVTIHMVASLDGFIARRDGSVDWMETSEAVKSPVNAFAAALRYEVRR